MDSILNVKGLSKSYERAGHKTDAVRDVSFELREGEILGIVGSSGSGKSTLFCALSAALKPPTRGIYISTAGSFL